MEFQVNDVVDTNDHGIARITRLGIVDGDPSAWIRQYGGTRTPIGVAKLASLYPTCLMTFALDENDMARLKEIRELCPQITNGFRKTPLSAYAREALTVIAVSVGLKDWTDGVDAQIHALRSEKRGQLRAFRVRVLPDIRDEVNALSDFSRHSPNTIMRAAIAEHLTMLRADKRKADDDARIEARVIATDDDENDIESIGPEQSSRPRLRILSMPEDDTGEWADEGDGIRCAASSTLSAVSQP